MEENNSIVKRPLLITILCVLSFLGGSYSVSSSLNFSMNPELLDEFKSSIVRSLEDYERLYGSSEDVSEMAHKWKTDVEDNLSVARFKKMNNLWMLGGILSLLGVMYMWRLRKLGFHLYVAGNLVTIIATFIVFGTSISAWIFASWHIVFGLIFTVLYSLKYRALR